MNTIFQGAQRRIDTMETSVDIIENSAKTGEENEEK